MFSSGRNRSARRQELRSWLPARSDISGLVIGCLLLLGLSACAISGEPVTGAPPSSSATRPPRPQAAVTVTATAPPSATSSPTIPATPTTRPAPAATATPQPARFATIPGNIAGGKSAPDFSMTTVKGETFHLSDRRGHYLLLLPTTPGCGPCMANLAILEDVYPDYRGQGVAVIFLDIYPQEQPGFWETISREFSDSGYTWAAVGSENFVLEYDIKTLGTIILVNPQGNVVFRSNEVIRPETYRHLLELATMKTR